MRTARLPQPNPLGRSVYARDAAREPSTDAANTNRKTEVANETPCLLTPRSVT
jgi:hypothetical protein